MNKSKGHAAEPHEESEAKQEEKPVSKVEKKKKAYFFPSTGLRIEAENIEKAEELHLQLAKNLTP